MKSQADFRRVLVIMSGVFLLGAIANLVPSSALAACPKVLMFDGVNIKNQTDQKQAKYWGKTVGIQGFFLNNIMADWQQDVGDNSASPVWMRARKFQRIYEKYGVVDNFIKVAIWKKHDWFDKPANKRVVKNFYHAALLAKNAGFKGVALDLEPYVPIWKSTSDAKRLTSIVYEEGKAIATAMHKAYPNMTLFIIDDALTLARLNKQENGGFELSVPFLKGLFSVEFKSVNLATEATYDSVGMSAILRYENNEYKNFIKANHLEINKIAIAPGIWPLGGRGHDKSPRMSPDKFKLMLETAFRSSADYVWIYGDGSAWQTGGTWGKGPVAGNFHKFTNVLHAMLSQCGK